MSDIELAIKIPEKDWKFIKEVDGCRWSWAILEGVINGTPLPKGHGRLIDANAFQKYCFNKNFDKRLSEEGLAIINMFLGFQPTIIEADKESEE